MTEKLVDVRKGNDQLLHVFPVTLDNQDADDGAFKTKALESAGHAGLSADKDAPPLTAEMHKSHSGPLEPQSDDLGVLAETREGLAQYVREQAYGLWQAAGAPQGRADEFWHQAEHDYLRRRAYALWEREGKPDGQHHDHWCRVCAHQGI